MKLKICNHYGLRISHIKFEWNRRQKKIFFQRGDPLVFFWFSKNYQRVPPLNPKKFFVSDSTQILCEESLGHKDCMFWISSKSETNFFFIFKGPFGVFPIFKVSIWRYWSTFTDKNRGTDSLECLNSGVNGCLNIKNFIWEQVLGVSTTFWWAIKQKIRGGHNGPPPGNNVFPDPR